MTNQQELTKFEFLLTLENNIICQRYFNVKNHNSKAKRSLNIHDYVKNICEEISEDLKIKSSDYLCENQNFLLNSEDVEEVNDDKKEYFLLEIKQDDSVFIQRIFPAYYYHPKVRYTVDIRPRLKNILSNLTDILSSENLETTYLGYELQ
jgi:spore coat polysaccharide biosynthesis protein SpsF (cytidylyltransferase family)